MKEKGKKRRRVVGHVDQDVLFTHNKRNIMETEMTYVAPESISQVGTPSSEQEMPEVDSLYDDRRNFCVIALTGYTASGCSRLAEYMSKPDFFNDGNVVRSVDSINFTLKGSFDNNDIYFKGSSQHAHENIAMSHFKCKYSICRDFIEHNYEPFTIIKYSNIQKFCGS